MADSKKKLVGWLLLGIGLIALYVITRLVHLTSLPIFTDEAIYIRWSQIGMRDANWRFISLTDGKQPMFTWIMMILLRVFQGHDPLFAGRFVSVLGGFFTAIGIWLLSYELFRDKRVSWMASVIYIILPFTVWYDRMALYDSLVSTFSVWSLYLAVQLAKYERLDTALLLGLTIGAGLLNKTSELLTLYFLPVTLLLFDWSPKQRWTRLIRWTALALVSAALSQICYSVLRLSPFFHMIAQKDNVFVFTFSEWMHQPFRFLIGNLRGMFDWMRGYMTLPLFGLSLVPIFARWPKFKERFLLFLWWLLPFAALANFAKILYPRYILFMVMPLIVLAAYGFVRLWQAGSQKIARAFLILFFLVPSLAITWSIVSNPFSALIPDADRGQFIDDWPAGEGVKEVVAYLKAEAASQKLSVYTEGTFGLMPYSLEIYLVENPNVKITGIWPLPPDMPQSIINDALVKPTYLVMNETQTAPAAWPLTLIGEYEKGRSPTHRKLRFYRVHAPVTSASPVRSEMQSVGITMPTATPTPTPTPVARNGNGNARGKKSR